MTTPPQLLPLNRLVGTWITEATHPDVPGVVVHGSTTFEWLEGGRFLIVRSRTDHVQFPDALCMIGDMREDRISDGDSKSAEDEDVPLQMHYFDSRGVFRVHDTSIDDDAWRWERIVAGLSQRFTGSFSRDGQTIDGQSQLRRDDVHWVDDLRITYRRERD